MITAGRPQLLAERCSSCVFRSGNLMHLRSGRLAALIQQNLDAGAALICHQTLFYGDHPEVGEAVCRGFYNAYGDNVNAIRVMHRLGGFQEVPAPTPCEPMPTNLTRKGARSEC